MSNFAERMSPEARAAFEADWLDDVPVRTLAEKYQVSGVTAVARAFGLPLRRRPVVYGEYAKAPAPAPGRAGRLLGGLAGNQCHWPIGDTKAPDFRFCGARTEPGRSYCPKHCRKAYTSLKDIRERDEAEAMEAAAA